MANKVSVKGTARRLTGDNNRFAKKSKRTTGDSFQNFMAQVGIGTDNLSSGSTYGFNPVTRNRILLEWIHRGSWAGGLAVDVVADDMTRAGVKVLGGLPADDEQELHEAVVSLNMWDVLNEATQGARLYGGSVMIPLIDGADMTQPFRADTIAKGQLKGFLALDRWQVDPTLEDLVQEMGPSFGLPKFYRVSSDAPGMRGVKVHHSRVLRQVGDRLLYWQRVMENLWGTSVYERMYDRLTAFDSASQGAAQLVYKVWLRTLKVDGLREIVSSGGPKMAGLSRYVEMFRRFQAFEGITLIDAKDDMDASSSGATGMAGLADVITTFAEQLAGSIQVPLTRLLGRSPGGMNATGDSDLKTYYDGILQKQVRLYQVPVTRFYRMIAASRGIDLPQGFKLEFNPLWQLDDPAKADVASKDVATVSMALENDIIDAPTAMEELSRLSEITGRFTTITPEMIEQKRQAEANPPNAAEVLPALDRGIAAARGEETGGQPQLAAAVDKGIRAVTGDGIAESFWNRSYKDFGQYQTFRSFVEMNSRLFGKGAVDQITQKVMDATRGTDLRWDDVKRDVIAVINSSGTRDHANVVAELSRRHNLQIVIENPRGSVRSGKDWSVTMPADYGYIRKTTGADGDQLDCYIGPDPTSGQAWVVHQNDPDTGRYDEDKVLLGFRNRSDALACYLAGHSRSLDAFGAIEPMSIEKLQNLVGRPQ